MTTSETQKHHHSFIYTYAMEQVGARPIHLQLDVSRHLLWATCQVSEQTAPCRKLAVTLKNCLVGRQARLASSAHQLL